MIRDFIEECLEEAKEEYFRNDHHSYGGQYGRDAEWETIFNKDIYTTYVEPLIEAYDEDFYDLSNKHSLYVYCLNLVKGE